MESMYALRFHNTYVYVYIYTNRSSICMCIYIYIYTSTYYGRFVYKYICVICIHKYIKLIMIEL